MPIPPRPQALPRSFFTLGASFLLLGVACLLIPRPTHRGFLLRILSSSGRQIQEDPRPSIGESASRIKSASGSVNVGGLCLTPEIRGRWVREVPRNFAAPVCCGWDSEQYKENPGQCGTEPMPKLTEKKEGGIYRGRPDFLAHAGGFSCTCTRPGRDFHDEYVWKSNALPEWDGGKTLCNLLGKRRLLLIGDSTMQQVATTLMNAVFEGGCQGQIYIADDDTLVGENLGASNRGEYWTKTVQSMNFPEIVVINVGAHILGEEDYTRVIDTILGDVGRLKETNPDVRIVWKTQSPGGCTENMIKKHPLDAGKTFPWDSISYNTYQHDKFFERDQETILKMIQNDVPILDLRMLYSRSDAHVNPPGTASYVDCLHMCMPGPLDVISVLFQKLLQTQLQVSKCLTPNEGEGFGAEESYGGDS
eukprot:CAMPEP_0113531820 /NCGR_PEP_ID=MMETSP0015_2-20120614/3707_1 /TAXON_ID=2838 /ORGANISM="Odontella" /LENGTH=418 /DNA_ID=CAMNT_0000430695 /DNA_START=96 /DNA_END=1352 /DNA_ORIENTATION=+ /assembly_acc=CAM_ASM_000160